MIAKPRLPPWQICNLCLGSFGIQFGFALQNANLTRIFQNLGASLETVPLLWMAGPITGLLVQPLVGYYSDHTWTRLGRRRPYFLIGASLAAVSLMALPHATTLWMVATLVWILDASLNLTMEPFRAFIADQMPPEQRPTGYLMQVFFAGLGSIVGSLLPWTFELFGVPSTAALGEISDAVTYAFYLGAAFLFATVCWSAVTTREYPPELLDKFDGPALEQLSAVSPSTMRRRGTLWFTFGSGALIVSYLAGLRGALYAPIGAAVAYGIFLTVASRTKQGGAFTTILGDLESMSSSMRRLALVQCCSWFTLFALWIYTTPAVARMHFGASGPGSVAYEMGANWVGVLFATYNGLAAVAALIIPSVVRRFGLRKAHLINLWMGAIGLLSMILIRDPQWLLASMIGLGFAWASIVSLPYALLSNNLPSRKMGSYIGIFNIFIVLPQLLAASVMALLLDVFAAGDPSYAFVIGAIGWFFAGVAVLRMRPA